MTPDEIATRVRNAFIMGMATTHSGWNGEHQFGMAPDAIANSGRPEKEADLWEFHRNPDVIRLADRYMQEFHNR